MGGDGKSRCLALVAEVSIHAPAWEATNFTAGSSTSTRFQSTPPRGRRPGCCKACDRSAVGFNPRPRVGGDRRGRRVLHPPRVSIHAPAWEATIDLQERHYRQCVSIHAPAWEATRRASGPTPHGSSSFNPRPRVGGDFRSANNSPLQYSFNPRPRVGGDACRRWHPASPLVSIHAPAWEATPSAPVTPGGRRVFQSTPPRGRRRTFCRRRSLDVHVSIHAPAWEATGRADQAPGRVEVSIHAPAWEATPTACPLPIRLFGFNPRPRVGGDQQIRIQEGRHEHVSIHAPAWEATRGRVELNSKVQVSIHAPAWEATAGRADQAPGRVEVSIHAPAWEATQLHPDRLRAAHRFQSTPPRGRRPTGKNPCPITVTFQSTPPRGRRQAYSR